MKIEDYNFQLLIEKFLTLDKLKKELTPSAWKYVQRNSFYCNRITIARADIAYIVWDPQAQGFYKQRI